MESTAADLNAAIKTCPRLAILSESELKSLLTDKTAFATSALKIFGANGTLMIADNKITGISDQSEVLRFNESVACNAVPETLNFCIDASQKAVSREIKDAIGLVNADVLDLFKSDFINQAIEVVFKIRETRDIEEAF